MFAELLVPVAVIVFAALVSGLQSSGERDYLLGVATAGVAGLTLFGVLMIDGTLLARLGRLSEEAVGDELRGAKGVWDVISNVPFANRDVDHAVIARAGVFAIEVKRLEGQQAATLDQVRDLDLKVEQARRNARDVSLALRSRGLPREVLPVLVLAGNGAPDLPASGEARGDVRVLGHRNSAEWLPRLREGSLDRDAAQRLAEALLAHRAGVVASDSVTT
jgi:hypothetical protein